MKRFMLVGLCGMAVTAVSVSLASAIQYSPWASAVRVESIPGTDPSFNGPTLDGPVRVSQWAQLLHGVGPAGWTRRSRYLGCQAQKPQGFLGTTPESWRASEQRFRRLLPLAYQQADALLR